MPDPTTEGMRLEQIERAQREHAQAKAAEERADEAAHEARAEKADYLREKLAERAKAEDEAGIGD